MSVHNLLSAPVTAEVLALGSGRLGSVAAGLLGLSGVVFALARVKQDPLVALTAYGLTAAIGPDRIFPTLPTAVTAYREWRGTDPR